MDDWLIKPDVVCIDPRGVHLEDALARLNLEALAAEFWRRKWQELLNMPETDDCVPLPELGGDNNEG